MISLSKYLNDQFTVAGTKSRRILLFDVDDTLIHTTAMIHIKKHGKLVKTITNNEFNTYKLGPGEEFDFEEFGDINILRKEIHTKYWRTMLREYGKGTHISIITARSDVDMIRQFFLEKGIDIKEELVFAVNDPKLGLKGTIAEKKAHVVSELHRLGYRTFVMFDDNDENLRSTKDLEHKFNIKVITIKA